MLQHSGYVRVVATVLGLLMMVLTGSPSAHAATAGCGKYTASDGSKYDVSSLTMYVIQEDEGSESEI